MLGITISQYSIVKCVTYYLSKKRHYNGTLTSVAVFTFNRASIKINPFNKLMFLFAWNLTYLYDYYTVDVLYIV